MQSRCPWCGDDPLYQRYHDEEWGVALYDDQRLFEFLVLESMQAGLSWITILRKRDHFRKALSGFRADLIARYDQARIERLMQNANIIRNRRKLDATVNNARQFLALQREVGSFSDYLWDFIGGEPIINRPRSMTEVPAYTPLSDRLAKDLKKRGFRFVGRTTVYAFMQATGMVNDHLADCAFG